MVSSDEIKMELKLSNIGNSTELLKASETSETIESRNQPKVSGETPELDNNYQSVYRHGLTFRAVLVGTLIGSALASGNMYMGLRIGFGINGSIIATILSYTIMRSLPNRLAGGFSIEENCIAQTVASASSGISTGFITGIPALYIMNLIPPLKDFWMILFIWCLACSLYGVCFAIPLRNYFIRQKNLSFPSPKAVHQTIQSLHNKNDNPKFSQTKWLGLSFLGSIIYMISTYFVPGLSKHHLLYALSLVTDSKALQTADLVWGWKFVFSPAFFGYGTLIDLNTSLSICLGSVLLWGIIGPLLLKNDLIITSFGYPEKGHSAQSWGLWVGISIVITASTLELLLASRSAFSFLPLKRLFLKLNWFQSSVISNSLPLSTLEHQVPHNTTIPASEYQIPQDHRISTWMWGIGLILTSTVVLLVSYFNFSISIWLGLLSLFLSLIFSLVGAQCTAATNINTTGIMAKGSQLILALIPYSSLQQAQTSSLSAATFTAMCAFQAADTIMDLKAGSLLHVSPYAQFIAQLIGVSTGIFTVLPLFILFILSYPCIINNTRSSQICPYPAPTSHAWLGATRALTTNIASSIPISCQIACLIASLISAIFVIARHILPKSYSPFIPNSNAIGIAFFIPTPSIGFVFSLGSLTAYLGRYYHPILWSTVGVILAASLISGETLAGIVLAILNLSGLASHIPKNGILCPYYSPGKC